MNPKQVVDEKLGFTVDKRGAFASDSRVWPQTTTHAKRMYTLLLATEEAKQVAEKERDTEVTRWQTAIYEACKKAAVECGQPEHVIDGAGSDSGDPLDFTLLEIWQGMNCFRERAEAAESRASSLKAELEQVKKKLARLIEAADCIQHWHDVKVGDADGMVVSAQHVRQLWATLSEMKEG